ncbi:hypothetical protein AM588_10001756 [Phytophthora nicotianae]|uniref:GIY-YIG domain-containing protein n=1 Tax=Phytophthora nicotianae TaxID=4792 RepID=A0A0W8CLA4_PHYNI|nr:hypothetical protein AM588_10001756 [Phytophthora nicotianae]
MIGSIYIIIHSQSDICYVGSTLNKELKQRWKQHKEDYAKWLKGPRKEIAIYPSFKRHGIDQFKIVLVKQYDVVDRKHLEAYEQLWINIFRKTAVNKVNPFSIKTMARKEYDKQYREMNKAKSNEKSDCGCGGKYTRRKRARHLQSKNHMDCQATQSS